MCATSGRWSNWKGYKGIATVCTLPANHRGGPQISAALAWLFLAGVTEGERPVRRGAVKAAATVNEDA